MTSPANKTSAWTPEEREAMAEQRKRDDRDAYELGPDGEPLRVEWMNPFAAENAALKARLLAELAAMTSGTEEHANKLAICQRMGWVE